MELASLIAGLVTAAAVAGSVLFLARQTKQWTELEELDLRPRHRGWLVSAETDAIYQRVRGVVFETASATAIADMADLFYYVDRDGDLVFLEKVAGYTSWTEYLENRAARERSLGRAEAAIEAGDAVT